MWVWFIVIIAAGLVLLPTFRRPQLHTQHSTAQHSGKACSGLTYVVTSTEEYRAIQVEGSSFTLLQGNETANGAPCDAVHRLQQGVLSFQKS